MNSEIIASREVITVISDRNQPSNWTCYYNAGDRYGNGHKQGEVYCDLCKHSIQVESPCWVSRKYDMCFSCFAFFKLGLLPHPAKVGCFPPKASLRILRNELTYLTSGAKDITGLVDKKYRVIDSKLILALQTKYVLQRHREWNGFKMGNRVIFNQKEIETCIKTTIVHLSEIIKLDTIIE